MHFLMRERNNRCSLECPTLVAHAYGHRQRQDLSDIPYSSSPLEVKRARRRTERPGLLVHEHKLESGGRDSEKPGSVTQSN